jgi:autoinducer 2-degrading protein
MSLVIVHVSVSVKPAFVDAFKAATIENGRESVKEPGIARFDLVQQDDDPTRFVLIEVYRSADAPAAHRDTRHYQVWRDTVADMMAGPRERTLFAPVFPPDEGW